MSELFQISSLSFSYPGQPAKALDDVTLIVEQGEFLVLCGPTGSGKSTLLRQLKSVLAPHGVKSGEILFEGTPLEQMSQRDQSQKIGFVSQSPENQIVTDKVWHELAFGLESLGYDNPTIRRRVAEMASFFGIQTWFYQNVTELSGGQKQLLNLASAMAPQPDLLVLDEPTSQLDPIAASNFLNVLGRINRELGTTVVLAEHRLEDVFPMASAAAVLDKGKLLCTGRPEEVGAMLKETGHPLFSAMPTPLRVWAAAETAPPCPVTVGEGRKWLSGFAKDHPLRPLPPEPCRAYPNEAAVEAKELWFRYDRESPDVVKGLSLAVKKGEFLALLGGNGVGKTTVLKLAAGLMRPYRGEVKRVGKAGMLPQNPQTLFVKKTLREELFALFSEEKTSSGEAEAKVAQAVALCRLEALLDRHPYDLSGGEQQRAALAKVLLSEPEILLMDEPTKGLDGEWKQVFAGILQALLNRGTAVLMVSHDIEFCARYAHRCALLFDGNIAAQGRPREFFSGNSFYTTSANRMARDLAPEAVTPEELIWACGGKAPAAPETDENDSPLPPVPSGGQKPEKLSWWRRLLAAVSGVAVLALFLQFMGAVDFAALGGLASENQLPLYAAFLGALFVFAAAVSRRSKPAEVLKPPAEKRKLARRTLAELAVVLLLVPLTLFFGLVCLESRKYAFISLLILLECMAPFFLVFEGRKPRPRELVVIAVLCALGVAGRAVFFMLPQCKPVAALTILAGAAFGGESGFLVGAVTMLCSNIIYAQGPWTPWQMFAMGMIGFLAGLLFRKGWLSRSRGALCAFGALAVILVYGGIMNPASLLMWSDEITWEMILAYCVSGFPFDCVHAAATAFFLWFGGKPMLEKLDRIKVKYGLVE